MTGPTGGRMRVEAPGPLATVQDQGRPGYAALGVPESGALDPPALRLANRLVGNPEGAAGLEVTLGGLRVTFDRPALVAVTGAWAPVTVGGAAAGLGCAVRVPAGATLCLGTPTAGVRSYLAVRGGLTPGLTLGSASTDLLSGLGSPLVAGDELPLGAEPASAVPALDQAPLAFPTGAAITLRAVAGPRDDWFRDSALRTLAQTSWTVDDRSNRVGLRLSGPALQRTPAAADRELPSEGTVAGSIQVPGGGRPVVFLADHPVTGGYPVIAVVVAADLALAAQARPGQRIRVRLVPGPALPST